MDFLSQYNANKFTRSTTTFTKAGGILFDSGSPKLSMGGSFIILNAQLQGNPPVRLRLYSDTASRDADVNRAWTDFAVSPTVALVADIVLTNTSQLTLDPPIIGNTFTGGEVYYHLSGSTTAATVSVTSYAIKPNNDSLLGNTSLIVSGTSIPAGNSVSGNITTSKSFLILSGSSSHISRLRLYSRPVEEVPSSEISRPFSTQTLDGSLLIADMMFDAANIQYPFVPTLEAYTWTNDNYSVGTGTVGYILENRTGASATITTSLYIYSTED
jgi:hypothetical protein